MKTPRTAALGLVILGVISALAGPSKPVPAPEGIVSWWRAERNANDAVGDNHGALRGNISFAAGAVGRGFGFNGQDEFVEVANSPSLNPTCSFTIEGWIYPRRDGHLAIMAKWGDTGDQGGQRSYTLHTMPKRGLKFGISDAANQSNLGPLPYVHDFVTPHDVLTLEAWNHVAAVHIYTKTNSTRQIFVNGQKVAERIDPPILVYNGEARVGIGATLPSSTSSREHFDGLIDELTFYDRPLTETEVQSIYQAGSGGKQIVADAPPNR